MTFLKYINLNAICTNPYSSYVEWDCLINKYVHGLFDLFTKTILNLYMRDTNTCIKQSFQVG